MAASDNLNNVQFYHATAGEPTHRATHPATPMMCAMTNCTLVEHGMGRTKPGTHIDVKPSSEYRSVHGTVAHFGP